MVGGRLPGAGKKLRSVAERLFAGDAGDGASDRDDLIAQCRSLGIDPHSPEARCLLKPATRSVDQVIEVLAPNWWPVTVYLQCQWTVVGAGMGGMVWQGIPSTEIQATCDLLDVPHEERPWVCEGVRILAAHDSKRLNKR